MNLTKSSHLLQKTKSARGSPYERGEERRINANTIKGKNGSKIPPGMESASKEQIRKETDFGASVNDLRTEEKYRDGNMVSREIPLKDIPTVGDEVAAQAPVEPRGQN